MKYELWHFSENLIHVVSYDHGLSKKLNRWLGYPYEKGSLQEGDEPVFKVPADAWIKLNKILKT